MELEVFFDYTCPYCYLGHRHLVALLPEFPHIRVVWRPCEAHPAPEPRMRIRAGGEPGWWRELAPRIARAGLALRAPFDPVPYCNLAIRGMYVVEEEGGDVEAYHQRVYEAVFVRSLDISDPGVVAECAAGLGVDDAVVEAGLNDPRYAQRTARGNEYAYRESGVWAVPAFRLGGERLDAVENVGVHRRELERFLRGAG